MARQYYTTARLSENQEKTPEGYLVCANVPIARTGALIYTAAELDDAIDAPAGRVVVSRTPDVLFAAQTIASFEGKPVTLMHPEEMLTPENCKEYQVGTIQNVRAGDGQDQLIADLLITDAEAIFAIEQGLREVSLGYDAEYVEDGPGIGHQSAMIGNHCALVPAGRCGPECAIQDKQSIKEKEIMTPLEKLKEKIKGIFASFDSAIDELSLEADAEEEKKVDDTKPDAKEEEKPAEDVADKEEEKEPAFDAKSAIDGIMQKIADIETAVAKLQPPEKKPDDETTDAQPDAQTLARAEILAPGIQATADIQPAALKVAYGTKDGKVIIDRLSGGEAPAFDSAALFIGAAELMTEVRKAEFADTKTKTGTKDTKILDQHAHFAARAKEVYKLPKFN